VFQLKSVMQRVKNSDLIIAAQVKKKGGNKKFDWQKWNTKLFTKLFGQPDALKYAPEVVAIFMSMLYDTISTDPE
jgi:hypothetical protein